MQRTTSMRKSNSNVNADRRAIRQALAILEEEGAIIDDNDDIDIPANINNIDEGLMVRHNQAQAQALSSAKIDEGLTVRHNQATQALSSALSWSPSVLAPTWLNPPVSSSSSSSMIHDNIPLGISNAFEQHGVLNPTTYMMESLIQNNNDNNNSVRSIKRIDSFSLDQALYFEPYQESEESEINIELLMALRTSNVDQLRSFLCPHGYNNNSSTSASSLLQLKDFKTCNQFGENLLHLACRMGISREVVEFLFTDCQVPVNVRDKFGRTPLHNSCMSTVPHFDNINFIISKAPKMLLFEDDNGKIPFDLIPPQCFEPWTQFLLSEEETGGKNLLRQAAEAIPW